MNLIYCIKSADMEQNLKVFVTISDFMLNRNLRYRIALSQIYRICYLIQKKLYIRINK